MAHVFRGRTLNEARGAAEAELGPELIVLQKRKVKRKGISGMLGGTEFEIEAGRPVSTAMLAAKLRERSEERATVEKTPFSPGVYDEESSPMRAGLADINKLHDEVRAMRAMLFRMSTSSNPLQGQLETLKRTLTSLTPATPAITHHPEIRQLVSNSGIDGAMAERLIAELQDEVHAAGGLSEQLLLDNYRDVLAEQIRIKPWPLANEGRQVIALVGPPGVGKTTTAAKIAARAISEENKTVTFINCDTFRVGAVEQTKRFAKLLGCRLFIVKKREDLMRAIKKANTDLVIVDTSGRGPTTTDAVETVLSQKDAFEDLTRHVLLCLPASIRHRDTVQVAETFKSCSPTAIAITKLDLTDAPGGLIHGSDCTQLPVNTLCMGQRVPEDIAPATAGRILDYLSPRQLHN